MAISISAYQALEMTRKKEQGTNSVGQEAPIRQDNQRAHFQGY